MDLAEHIALFITACRAAGLASRTISWYDGFLTTFRDWCGERAWCDVATLREFLADLQSRSGRYANHPKRKQVQGGLSPYTLRGYVRALKRFFRWLVNEELIERDPSLRLVVPRLPKNVPRGVEIDDVRRLLGAVKLPRDRALLLFLLDTGCRQGEIRSLRSADLDLKRGIAVVCGKGRQQRFIFLSPVTITALSEYIGDRSSSEYVFLTTRGKQLGDGAIGQMLMRLAKRAGVLSRFNPHAWRHGFAKHYLMQGGDLASLSDLLGHADIETTKMYSAFAFSDLQKKHTRYSPIGMLEE